MINYLSSSEILTFLSENLDNSSVYEITDHKDKPRIVCKEFSDRNEYYIAEFDKGENDEEFLNEILERNVRLAKKSG